MLMLMRRPNESFLIYPEDIPEDMTVKQLFADGPIKIEVTETNNAQCKIGIKAPLSLNVVRSEIYNG
jgi:sRNA-binding carbon storage regulator CsrA